MYPANFVPNSQYPQPQIEQAQPVFEQVRPISENEHITPIYGETSVKAKCPRCKRVGFTSIEREIGMSTWMVSLALTVFCLVPCNYFPFCMPQCKDAIHHCGNCDFVVGKKPLLG